MRVFDHLGHRASTVFEPLTLESTAALPVEDVPIAEGRNFEVSEIVRSQVFHQRAVWHDDDVLFSEPLGVVEHLSVVFEHQPLIGVGAREGLVESATVFTNCNAERAKPFLTCAVKNLEG